MRIPLLLLAFLLLPTVNATGIADFPDAFSINSSLNAHIVMGSKAGPKDVLFVINYLVGEFPNTKDTSSLTIVDSEINSKFGKFIIVGNPCQNSVVAGALNTNSCSAFEPGVGYLELTMEGHLIISGGDEKGLEKAFIALKNQSNSMTKSKYLILGTKEPFTLKDVSSDTLSSQTSSPSIVNETKKNETKVNATFEGNKTVDVPENKTEPVPIEKNQSVSEPIDEPKDEPVAEPQKPVDEGNWISRILTFLKKFFLKPE
jgi:hypothetical protein